MYMCAHFRLTVELSVYCDANYYDEQCSTFCVPMDNCGGHYSCDPATGAQVCLPGWSGDDCTERMVGTDPVCSVAVPASLCKSSLQISGRLLVANLANFSSFAVVTKRCRCHCSLC